MSLSLPRLGATAALTFSLFAGACATGPRPAPGPGPGSGTAVTSGSGAAPAVAVHSVAELTTDEDADRTRQDLELLPEGDPRRLASRQALVRFYAAQAEKSLSRGHDEDAFSIFTSALALFEAAELQDPARPPAADPLLPVAEKLDQRFSRRGSHPEVITALAVQIALRPKEARPQERYRALADWMSRQSSGMQDLMRSRGRGLSALLADPPPNLQSDLEQTYRVWPSWFVRDQLVPLYRAEAQSQMAGGKRDPREFLQSLSRSLRRKGLVDGPAFKLARLYLRCSRPGDAVAAIEKLPRLTGEEGKLLDLLKETLASTPNPKSADEPDRMMGAIKLALALSQNVEDAEVSLQICRDVAKRTPALTPAYLCIGELATALERKGMAVRALEQARTQAPGERAVWEMLGKLYVERLSELVSAERTQELSTALSQIEAYYQRMRKEFPESSAALGMAVALAEVGRGYYNAGRIEEARQYLQRSIDAEPNPGALELLGVLELRREHFRESAATLERARAVYQASKQGDAVSKELFQARIGRLISEALSGVPDADRAREVRTRSLRAFERLLDLNRLSPERAAEVELERGRLLYDGGDREPALESFRHATELVPSDDARKDKDQGPSQIFVDLLAFLVQRGEVDEALDVYHRAIGRARLSESMKVYCSLWIADLLERSKQQPDPLAKAFLSSVQGGKWHADLARWAVGLLPEEELLRRADTPGKLTEAEFYLGMAALRADNRTAYQQRLAKVKASNMLGFFEYEMATGYLRRGSAPTSPVLTSKPAVKRPARPQPPPGSL